MTREEQIFAYKELRNNGQAFFVDNYEDADRIIEALENKAEHDKQIRAEIIDECIEKLYEVTPQTVDEKLDMVFVNALRELKENK